MMMKRHKYYNLIKDTLNVEESIDVDKLNGIKPLVWNDFALFLKTINPEMNIPIIHRPKFTEDYLKLVNLRNEFIIKGLMLYDKGEKISICKLRQTSVYNYLHSLSATLVRFIKELNLKVRSTIKEFVELNIDTLTNTETLNRFIEMARSDLSKFSSSQKNKRELFLKLFIHKIAGEYIVQCDEKFSKRIEEETLIEFPQYTDSFKSSLKLKRYVTLYVVNEILYHSLRFKTPFKVSFLDILKFVYDSAISTNYLSKLSWDNVRIEGKSVWIDEDLVENSCCHEDVACMFVHLYENRSCEASVFNVTSQQVKSTLREFENLLLTKGSETLKNSLTYVKLNYILKNPFYTLDELSY